MVRTKQLKKVKNKAVWIFRMKRSDPIKELETRILSQALFSARCFKDGAGALRPDNTSNDHDYLIITE
ncbi:hypothetical protein KR50_20240 [Jeotgalibacillus campisalis]|uniref:Uncharacterized protein n=1 Tax=Jeotgalibacillus campisalis TaxID=220754 RepID=A0A0C2VG41_9BACL|nr:hypothetical protein KR50_20240 [Jeotgalibacillus campisalis]